MTSVDSEPRGERRETVCFLHGIGVGPSSWDLQIEALPEGFSGFAPRLAGLHGGDGAPFTLGGAAAGILRECDLRGVDRIHLCGLSLGAMVATQFAIAYPERVASLVLSGSQVHPSALLMKIQSLVLGLLPRRLVSTEDMTKGDLLAALRATARTDFRPHLARITAPALVLCGTRDVVNLGASVALAAGLHDARLRIVHDAGHTWNTRMPDRFDLELATFYRGLER